MKENTRNLSNTADLPNNDSVLGETQMAVLNSEEHATLEPPSKMKSGKVTPVGTEMSKK